MRTIIIGIVAASVLGYAVWYAKDSFNRKAASEAVSKQVPTVVMPQGNDSTFAASYRWCD